MQVCLHCGESTDEADAFCRCCGARQSVPDEEVPQPVGIGRNFGAVLWVLLNLALVAVSAIFVYQFLGS